MDMALHKPRDCMRLNSCVGQCEWQLIMYTLDVYVSYSTYLVIFTARDGSREAQNFP